MKKFNLFCSLILIITTTVCIIAFAQNITLRTTATYTFYFNDTYVVEDVFEEYTNSEVSDILASFFNSWNPEEFQVYEDTGYDIEGVFDKKDSYNMLAIKRALDISLILSIVSFIITAAIYFRFLKLDYKPIIRKRFKVSAVLATGFLIGEMFLLNTKKGLAFLSETLGLVAMEKDSDLMALLGIDFIELADNFLFGFTILTLLVAGYITHFLTKPPRIFF